MIKVLLPTSALTWRVNNYDSYQKVEKTKVKDSFFVLVASINTLLIVNCSLVETSPSSILFLNFHSKTRDFQVFTGDNFS